MIRTQRRSLAISVLATALALVAFAAVAIGPGILGNLGSPGGSTKPQPQSGPIETPTWNVGDTWTYDVNASAEFDTVETTWMAPALRGTVTRTVVSADGSLYNVSLAGTFDISKVVDLARETDFGNATITLYSQVVLEDATVDGYTWYRASDLAKISEVRTVHVSGSFFTDYGTYDTAYDASYTLRVETTYDPPLDLWAFPLGENETWIASINATVQVWKTWRVEGPNWYFEKGRNFTFTVPNRILLASGVFEDVTTPAGTFPSIPVSTGLHVMELVPMTDQMAFAMHLGDDGFMEPHTPVEAWFSGDVGNVVKAETHVDGLRVVVELASYDRA